jgi:D-tyrosyl-tRNA(Tyr) deacylase
MRVILQRIRRAEVRVEGQVVGRAKRGHLLLVGFTGGDDAAVISWMADKIIGLRVFPDDEGKMNRSLTDVRGDLLVVSQFTLYGDTSKGRRPSFVHAADPEAALSLYERFVKELRSGCLGSVEAGQFGADMEVDLINDGPVTLVLER